VNPDELRDLIRIVEESDIDELEISRWGRTVRIVKRRAAHNSAVPPPAYAVEHPAPGAHVAPAVESREQPQVEETREPGHLVESPMVGTFYRAPAPEAPAFVEVGDSVRVGQTLCILEAMKLMNELQSEVNGVVRKILVDNGSPVEYGQPLFEIEPR
jgi:acetyl-CoA carboxylase biotin carboxyl carrier protein